MRNLLVTGGAGFIGSHVVDLALSESMQVICLDLLTYAGRIENLDSAMRHKTFKFIQGDICDSALVRQLLKEHSIDAILNLAAETHVDNSILGPKTFIQSNIVGTFSLLEAARDHWISNGRFREFRFIQVSTDEVFGELGVGSPAFNETTSYMPNSPYSASKAASDHLVRAWWRTYGLPTIVTNSSNNFGARQHSEKLIPTVVKTALENKPIPVYGNGSNIRDWLFVEDHARGLLQALKLGRPGQNYCFGGNKEIANLDLVKAICQILDADGPKRTGGQYSDNICFVTDRLGHDWRYAVDSSKANAELGFRSGADFFHQPRAHSTLAEVTVQSRHGNAKCPPIKHFSQRLR